MPDLFLGYGDEIAWGFLVTAQMAFLSGIVGLTLGALIAWAKVSDNRVARVFGDIFTTVVRGTPELLIILIVFFGSTTLITKIGQWIDPSVRYVEVPPIAAGVFALSMIFAGYSAEILRGAVLALPKPEVEAGVSVGMSSWQLLRYVKLPNIWRIALPGLGNHWLSLVKDTALISVIGLEEMMRLATIASSVTQEPFRFFSLVTAIYLVFNFINNELVGYLERRANYGRSSF